MIYNKRKYPKVNTALPGNVKAKFVDLWIYYNKS